MPRKTDMTDLVIVVPGIMGSVLQKDGKNLWTARRQVVKGVVPFMPGISFDALMMNGDDYELDDLGDGIEATGLSSLPDIITGLIKTGTYKNIKTKLAEVFNIEEGDTDITHETPANFIEFPYDWRRDIRSAARKLDKLINHKLQVWRDFTGNKEAQVILLAHSMGGLVSRYYLEALNGYDKCSLLVTFGTPHLGSVQSLDFLSNKMMIGLQNLTKLARSFTSTYQLLPNYQVINNHFKVTDLELPNIDRERAKKALEFYQEIDNAVEAHENDAQYFKTKYDFIPIVGRGQKTLQSASFSQGKLICDKKILPPSVNSYLNDGDDTVPCVSAVPREWGRKLPINIGETHGCLQENEVVLSLILNHLKERQTTRVRGPEDSSILTDETRPFLSVHCADFLNHKYSLLYVEMINSQRQSL
ncbi:MAG: lecithin--cholesterol acyltransferase [Scytonematopsis contorta HA4267-MV1]|jgi:pimeloyl-ACP methyl ester carboxylesterase|nr:lecithin--cholesterol acyltransferase [Scytonematopsis contorta HA4267-MV1]